VIDTDYLPPLEDLLKWGGIEDDSDEQTDAE
jgi:hypothetical protein